MKKYFRLDGLNVSLPVGLAFAADIIVIDNPTGSPILLRVGSPEIPTTGNADYTIPANGVKVLPVQGRQFGLTFSDFTLVGTQLAGNLGNYASILFLTQDEPMPSYGAASYQSLSLSPLTNGFLTISGPGQTGTLDLGSWGGMLISLIPNVGSGQGVIQVQVTDTPTVSASWKLLGTWSFWANIPVLLLVARTARYARILVNATTIAGEPVISASLSARATIAEITEVSYQPIGASITTAFNIAALGTQRYTFVTVGIEAITIGINITTGTVDELIVEASQSPAGPWRTVMYREQNAAGTFNSIYRTIGQLDLFTRVSILEIGNNPGGTTGTLTMSMTSEPDLNGMLQNIYAALGDVGQSGVANVGQSLWHLLKTIDVDTGNIAASAGTIATNTATINTTLGTTNSNLATISSSISSTNSLLTTINGNVAPLHGDLVTTINGSLGSIISNQGTIHNDLVTVNSYLLPAFQAMGRSVGPSIAAVTCALGGTWYSAGAVFVPGWWVTGWMISVTSGVPGSTGTELALFYGTAGAPISPMWQGYIPWTQVTVTPFRAMVPFYNAQSSHHSGYLLPAGYSTLWAQAVSGAGTVGVIVTFNQTP